MATQQKYEAFETALTKAHEAAKVAQIGMVEDRNALDCGFAWVTVQDRSFMTFCRKRAKETGDTGYYGDKSVYTGWQFWKPGRAPVQSIGIHEAGARAFRDVIAQELGLYAEMSSRLD